DGMIKGYNGRVAKAERRRFRFTNYDPGYAVILFAVITLDSWAVHRGRGPAALIVLLAVVGVYGLLSSRRGVMMSRTGITLRSRTHSRHFGWEQIASFKLVERPVFRDWVIPSAVLGLPDGRRVSLTPRATGRKARAFVDELNGAAAWYRSAPRTPMAPS